jgi:UDP-glucose 4-epimerase
MRVLVTGGAGFIGSHIVDALIKAGHEPHVIDDLSSGTRANLPADVPVYEVDVCDGKKMADAFAAAQPELVCHQAAQMSVSVSVKRPVFDAQVNVVGLLQSLELAAQHDVGRFVFASSGGVLYGDVAEPVDELHPANPISPYGISKWVGEKYLQFFSQQHGMETVAMRYANVYGPRQNPHGEAGVVAIFCTKMLAGEAPTIFGDGSCVRDYVFVEDVTRANLAALTCDLSEPFNAFNIGTATPTDVNQLAASLQRSCQQNLDTAGRSITVPAPEYGPSRAGDLQSSLICADLAGQVLDWRPQVAIDEGSSRTANWFAEQLLV